MLFVSSVVGSALLASLAVLVRATRSGPAPAPEPAPAPAPEPEPESEGSRPSRASASSSSRPERFGAFVALEAPPALVAVDRVLAKKLGVDGGALFREPDPGLCVPVLSAPTEVHVSVTERCPAGCTGCYADATPDGHEPTFEELAARLDALAEMGVFSVAFGGGEASLREDVTELAAYARRAGLVPTVTTSGLGITPERAPAFRSFAQVNVSFDGPPALYREVRGYDGAKHAERAITWLREAGVSVGVNTVLTRETFDALDEIARHAEALGAVELQLLRFKPSGRGRLDYLARRLTDAQVARFGATLRALSETRSLALRIDCALVPFLAASGQTTPEDLARFGVMGCEAGRSLMTLDARGAAKPCSFWEHAREQPAHAEPGRAWNEDAALADFRGYAATMPEPCASCTFRTVCRGGCRIVARHLGPTAFAPDPECPRVRAALGD
jgi:radical SAM protein with 4Fe4S-binding SPASM domain